MLLRANFASTLGLVYEFMQPDTALAMRLRPGGLMAASTVARMRTKLLRPSRAALREDEGLCPMTAPGRLSIEGAGAMREIG